MLKRSIMYLSMFLTIGVSAYAADPPDRPPTIRQQTYSDDAELRQPRDPNGCPNLESVCNEYELEGRAGLCAQMHLGIDVEYGDDTTREMITEIVQVLCMKPRRTGLNAMAPPWPDTSADMPDPDADG